MYEKRIQQYMVEVPKNTTSIMTSTLAIQYFTGFYSEPYERLHALIILPSGKQYLLIPSLVKDLALKINSSFEIIAYEDNEQPWVRLKDTLTAQQIPVHTIGIEGDHFTYNHFQALHRTFDHLRFITIDDNIQSLRMSKSNEEIAFIQQAVAICETGIEAAKNALCEGITELEIVDVIQQTIKNSEADGLACEPIALFGENTANPHGEPSHRPLKKGDLVQIDYGVSYNGYCSDLARVFVFGEATEQQKELYQLVLAAQQAAIEAIIPGNAIATIDQAARQTISNKQYGEHFLHRTGHGIGLDIHEAPSINGANEALLAENSVITIEPGIYLPGIGGVRIEDNIVATQNGPTLLSTYPKQLIEI